MTQDNRFFFVVPMFNASETLGQMLHSLCGQSYDNWRVILIDDCSSQEEIERENWTIAGFRSLLQATGEDPDRIRVTWNSEGRGKQWEVSNVLHGISQCDDDDIVCRIDADDWLTDLDALAMIASTYQATGCDALWTGHRWGFSDKNISCSMPDGVDVHKHPWVSSHLKTFRKRLLNDVKDENYRNEDGDYVRRAGDQAIYLPALYHAKKRVFLPRCTYHYTISDVPETYQTDDARFQRDEALFLRARGYVK